MELMKLSRRDFGRGIASTFGVTLAVRVLGVGALSGAALLEEGCSSSTVVNEINVVLQQAAAVLAVVEPNAPWVAEFKAAVAALMVAEQQWTTGGTVQIVIDALNTIVAITAVIPVTMPYSPLIALLVAGIEAILAALPPSSNNAGVRATAMSNPYLGPNKVVLKHRLWHSPASDFKAQWNETAKAQGLQTALLK